MSEPLRESELQEQYEALVDEHPDLSPEEIQELQRDINEADYHDDLTPFEGGQDD